MRKAFLTAVVLGALAAPLAADRIDDDLAAVKRAVGTAVTAEATPVPAAAAAEPAPPARAERAAPARRAEKVAPKRARTRGSKDEPRWLRVRIVEKGDKHGRVAVNLPLDLVRALGEDVKIEDCRDAQHPDGRTVGDILRALQSGENLVDIDDEDSTVHVWVE